MSSDDETILEEEQTSPKESKKQEEKEATKKAFTTGAKAAANTYLGPAGGKAVDLLSKTKLGNAVLNKGADTLNKGNPAIGKMANVANKTGALDAADKAVDASSGDISSKSDISSKQTGSALSNITGSGEGNSTADIKGSIPDIGTLMESFIKKYKFQIIGGLASVFLILVIILIVIGAFYSVAEVATNFINGIVDFLTTDQQEAEADYYNTLKEIQDEFREDYDVCIDINLITAALTINTSIDDMLNNGSEIVEDTVDNPNYDPDDENSGSETSVKTYKLMKKQVKLLAKMQMITKNYELDDSSGSYCETSKTIEPITSGNKDSSNMKLVADRDLNAFFSFFTVKSSEEKNDAYYTYKPIFDSDGSCSHSYAKKQLKSEPKYEVSIGDYDTRKDSVFYWNLVSSFIPYYYEDYIPDTEPAKSKRIEEMADEIYLLYKDIGPSKTCGVSYAGPSSLAPNGITVEGVGTFSLEEYVAGVVSGESYPNEGMEALKAQAVAARTYVLKYTNYGAKAIPDNTNAQNFDPKINDRAKEAANSTAGEILTYNGSIFLSEYDSFCYQDIDCPDAVRNSDGTYTVTYTKLPSGEKHKITLSNSKYYGWMVYPDKGHSRGMSQLLSYQLAAEGKTYKEILNYFYSDGVEISRVLTPNNTDGASIIAGSIGSYLTNVGSSVEQMNSEIYTNVKNAGLGTRNGVVAAATSLVSGFYNKTGYKLPYELNPSGKYSGYGMDPNWGNYTGDTTYKLEGLDCSGFISWAIHNGGYSYVVKNAQGWGNSGTKRNWSKGTTDSSAQPGDLIYNAPASNNGTSGHIRMIIGVTDSGYTVAEASSGKNGIRITDVSFTSVGPYYLVDMSNYYSSATKVNDYPM